MISGPCAVCCVACAVWRVACLDTPPRGVCVCVACVLSVCVECVFRESLRGRIHVASEREREECTASAVTASVYACVYACVYVLLQQAFMCSCISRAPCATIVPHGSHVGREGGREGRREGDCIDQHACASLAFSVVQFEYENKHLLQLSVCLMRPSCVICSVLFCRVSAVCLPCHFPVCPFCLSPPVSLTLFLSLSFSRSLARARSPARRAPCFACTTMPTPTANLTRL